MNNTILKVLVAALFAHTVACSAPPTSSGTGGGSQGGTHTGFGSAEKPGNGGGAATCDDACAHYLECKDMDTADNRKACDAECNKGGLSEEQLANFVQTDCKTAVAAVDGQQGQTGGGGGSQSNQCSGCVNDGDGCNWYSQSDWGAGAYSGAVSSCDPSCCK